MREIEAEKKDEEEKVVNFNVGVYDKNKLRARGQKHARAICDVLPRYDFRPHSMLDVGCADGSITTALMDNLNIRSKDTYGCDISSLTEEGKYLLLFSNFYHEKLFVFHPCLF